MNFAKLKETRNIILLVIFFCCIGGCGVAYMYDQNKDEERSEIIRQLPQLYSEESIHEAIQAPETKAYLFVGHKFERYESVKDPMKKRDGEFLYIKGNKYKWKQDKKKNGVTNYSYEWKHESELKECGKIFMDKSIELEGFSRSRTSFYNFATDEITEEKYKYEYEYVQPSMQFTFIAELGKNHAKLGYNGTNILVAGNDIETLIKQTNISSGLFGTKSILLIICVAILIFLYQDMKKK
ncbi:MAG: hypothetical protein J6X05_06960 [Bacteroidales bacterium]|nr:hypothetical protein [Bacteroidales bacterium]